MPDWTRKEHLIALNLYIRIPLKEIKRRNPEVIRVLSQIGHNFNGLRAVIQNFASREGKSKFSHVSQGAIELWEEFLLAPQLVGVESEIEIGKLLRPEEEPDLPDGPTDSERTVKIRLVQRFFRNSVLASYNNACAFCGLEWIEMLIASHIIPWSVNEARRADPRNGICLCVFHDRAFDRGFLGVGDSLEILVSPKIPDQGLNEMAHVGLIGLKGKLIRSAERFQADPEALAYHRTKIFRS